MFADQNKLETGFGDELSRAGSAELPDSGCSGLGFDMFGLKLIHGRLVLEAQQRLD